MHKMLLATHTARDEDDYWRIRAFLREVFLLNGRRPLSWDVSRLDYWRWHGLENLGQGRLDRDVFIWETADGQIGAVLNREGPGEAFLQLHPGLRTPELEEELLVVAESHLAVSHPEGRKLLVWANAVDNLQQAILSRRGYVRSADWPEHQRRRPLSMAIPDGPVAAGYTVRALGDVGDLPARSWASWTAFHPDAPDEQYGGWEWYQNIQCAPLYRRDLDIVAVAPGGEIVSFCTAWYDDVTRSACFEPVGTAPAHQRQGLASAVIREGLRRLRRMGATQALVSGYSPEANALYASAGFTECNLSEPWEKRL